MLFLFAHSGTEHGVNDTWLFMSVAVCCHTDHMPWKSAHLLQTSLFRETNSPEPVSEPDLAWDLFVLFALYYLHWVALDLCQGPGFSGSMLHSLQSVSARSLSVLWGHEHRMPWKSRWSGQDTANTANSFSISLSLSFSFLSLCLSLFLSFTPCSTLSLWDTTPRLPVSGIWCVLKKTEEVSIWMRHKNVQSPHSPAPPTPNLSL